MYRLPYHAQIVLHGMENNSQVLEMKKNWPGNLKAKIPSSASTLRTLTAGKLLGSPWTPSCQLSHSNTIKTATNIVSKSGEHLNIEHREPSYHGNSYIIVAVYKNQTPNLNFVYYEINEERSVCTSMHKCMLKTAAYSMKFKSKTKK